MNKPAMSAIRKQAQAGFTLIELIVVIVILGILAATALPKFANLGGDARVASLKAVQGSMAATAAMAHGQWLVDQTRTTVVNEGTTITFATAVKSGYPKADASFLTASGVNASDFATIGPSSTDTANTPVTTATEIVVTPAAFSGTPKAKTCYVKYTEPANVGDQPTFTPVVTDC